MAQLCNWAGQLWTQPHTWLGSGPPPFVAGPLLGWAAVGLLRPSAPQRLCGCLESEMRKYSPIGPCLQWPSKRHRGVDAGPLLCCCWPQLQATAEQPAPQSCWAWAATASLVGRLETTAGLLLGLQPSRQRRRGCVDAVLQLKSDVGGKKVAACCCAAAGPLLGRCSWAAGPPGGHKRRSWAGWAAAGPQARRSAIGKETLLRPPPARRLSTAGGRWTA